MRLGNVNIQEFLPKSMSAQPPIEGMLAARVKLKGAGDSVHAAAAASNGAVTVVIPQGKIRAAFAELLGVDAGKGLGLLLSKNQGQTNIRCAIADFAVKNGVLQAQDVVFDTDVVRVNGHGDIDLGDESINLTLKGDPKQFRITHLLLPISITGPSAPGQFRRGAGLDDRPGRGGGGARLPVPAGGDPALTSIRVWPRTPIARR